MPLTVIELDGQSPSLSLYAGLRESGRVEFVPVLSLCLC